jgi:hypothetical protein
MRMFVSTKYLSLIKLVAGLRRRPAQVEAFFQAGERATSGTFEFLALADERFEPIGDESAE